VKPVKLEELQPSYRNALFAAAKVMETAYNPYSKFYVGAALVAPNGRIICGSNVENSAYGSTICAERAAIMRANAMGLRVFRAIAVIARAENADTAEVTGPCGSCRQMLFELSQISEQNLEVILSTTQKDKIILASIQELLPLGFGPKDLGVDIRQYQR
jgi:cytidine deaminase